MSDEEIEALAAAIKAGPVWWICDGSAKLCRAVIPEWFEIFHGGIRSDVSEPAVQFVDGGFAALYLSDASEFVRRIPAILPVGLTASQLVTRFTECLNVPTATE